MGQELPKRWRERRDYLQAIINDPDSMRFFDESQLEQFKLELDLLKQGKIPDDSLRR